MIDYLAQRDAWLVEMARQEQAEAHEEHVVLYQRKREGIEHATRVLPDRQTAEDLAAELRRHPAVAHARAYAVRKLNEESSP